MVDEDCEMTEEDPVGDGAGSPDPVLIVRTLEISLDISLSIFCLIWFTNRPFL